MNREPAIIIGSIVGVIESLIAVLVVVGTLPIDVETQAAVMGAVAAIGAAAQAVWTRSRVYSPASMEKAMIDR